MKIRRIIALALLALSTLNPQLSILFAQGTAFTYQGRLSDGTELPSGIHEFRFALYNSLNASGTIIAGPLTNSGVAVSNGLFTVSLDFGVGVFNGAARWLEIGVRTSGSAGNFTTLVPRQALTPAPYASFAANAGLAIAVPPGAITSSMLANGAVTSNKIAPGAISALDAPDGSPLRALIVNSNGAVGIGGNDSGAALQVAGGGSYRNPANPAFVRAVTNRSATVTNMAFPIDVFVAGNRAYVTAYHGSSAGALVIFDLTNPLQPVFLGEALDDGIRPGSPFTRLAGADSVVVTNNIAYVTAENENAVTIINVANPQNLVKLAELVHGTGGIASLELPTDIIVDRTNLYVLGFLSSALAVFDVSNPASPQLRTQIFDDSVMPGSPFTKLRWPIRMKLAGQRLYIAARGDSAITILDVSNPASPQLLGEIVDDSVNPNSPFKRLANANGVDVIGNRLYAVSGAFAGPDGSLTIIDVSNPASPVKLSEVSDESIDPGSPFTKLRGAWEVKVVDQTAFVTSFSDDAVTAIDVSNPHLPRLIKEFVQGQGGLTTFQFTQGIDVSGNTLYVTASSSSALNILDLRGTLGLKVDGAVGIGTATPRSALDVAGTIRGTDLAVDAHVFATDIAAADSITAVGNVLAGGRVGIGTNSPLAPLHVVSAGPVNTFLDGGSTIGTWLVLGNRAGGTNWNFISTGTNNGEGAGKLLLSPGGFPGTVSSLGGFVLEPNGRLGLGTFTPGARLDVAGPSGNSVRIHGPGGDGATVALDLATYNPDGFGTNIPSARIQATDRNWSADVDVLTKAPGAPTNPMVSRLHVSSATGFVGIGTTSPAGSLQVNGSIRTRGGPPGPFGNANNGITFGPPGDGDSGVSSSGDGQVEFYSNSTEVMRIAAGGNVGIGTTVPLQRLHVIGNILASGTITPNSDRNAKTDFGPVDPRAVLEKVAALPISSWRFKAEPEDVRHVGPMAQDFQSAFGLGEQKTAIATVDADGVALAAIQGLNQKLTEELRQKATEIMELKQRLEALEKLITNPNTKGN